MQHRAFLAGERSFEHILIDLDDTLYLSDEISDTVRRNIQAYMVKKLGVSLNEVEQLTARLYAAHGTTMAGLAAEGHVIDVDDWHAAVHGTLDYDRLLSPDPETRSALADIVPQRHVLTNADAAHAAVCLSRLGIDDCFSSLWCYENVNAAAADAGLITKACPVMCKPNRLAFRVVLDAIGAADPSAVVFVDDSLRNVAAAHELGIFTVLVSPSLCSSAPPAQHHVLAPGADLVIPCFPALREVLPQIFVQPEAHEPSVPAGVPVRVMAS